MYGVAFETDLGWEVGDITRIALTTPPQAQVQDKVHQLSYPTSYDPVIPARLCLPRWQERSTLGLGLVARQQTLHLLLPLQTPTLRSPRCLTTAMF